MNVTVGIAISGNRSDSASTSVSTLKTLTDPADQPAYPTTSVQVCAMLCLILLLFVLSMFCSCPWHSPASSCRTLLPPAPLPLVPKPPSPPSPFILMLIVTSQFMVAACMHVRKHSVSTTESVYLLATSPHQQWKCPVPHQLKCPYATYQCRCPIKAQEAVLCFS